MLAVGASLELLLLELELLLLLLLLRLLLLELSSGDDELSESLDELSSRGFAFCRFCFLIGTRRYHVLMTNKPPIPSPTKKIKRKC